MVALAVRVIKVRLSYVLVDCLNSTVITCVIVPQSDESGILI
jgi:hypothetical protein